MEFWQWLVTDWHWFWVAAAIWFVWIMFIEDIVDKFLKHRRDMKELELRADPEKRKPLP